MSDPLLACPNGIVLDEEHNLYVACFNNGDVIKISWSGEVELFAGSGKRGHDNGPALEATFSYADDLAFSPDAKVLHVNENGSLTEPHTELVPTVVRAIRIGE